jgi:hypothetical protein
MNKFDWKSFGIIILLIWVCVLSILIIIPEHDSNCFVYEVGFNSFEERQEWLENNPVSFFILDNELIASDGTYRAFVSECAIIKEEGV